MSDAFYQIPIRDLDGIRVLVVEDEPLVALEIEITFTDAGAEVIGPCATVAAALDIAKHEALSVASLDIFLGRETTENIADILLGRGIPFFFYSGQSMPGNTGTKWSDCVHIRKPAAHGVLIRAVSALAAAE
jgi:DNA-binding NarL/FixJ family response regulator